MMIPAASASVSAVTVSPVTTGNSPGINVSLANGDSYNISYSYLLLIATVHTSTLEKKIVFGADLQDQNWTISKTGSVGNTTYTYSTGMVLMPTTRNPLGYGNQSFLSPDSVPKAIANLFPRIQMKVVIKQNSNTQSIVVNTTNGTQSSIYQNLSISTITIDNYIKVTYFPSESIKILTADGLSSFSQNYRIELLQGIEAHLGGLRPDFHQFNGSENASTRPLMPIGGVALLRPSGPANTQGFFWWPHNYTSGSSVLPVQPYIVGTLSGIDLGFQYFGNSTTSIIQDPYFSILNTTLSGQIVNQKLQQAYTEIMENLSLFSSGIIFGAVLIGISYTIYRRRRV